MGFELRSTLELVQIASAGGGLRLEASLRSTLELVQIAAAASKSGARITFSGLTLRPTLELVQIASAGRGNIILEG
jgi:hypothetical protein